MAKSKKANKPAERISKRGVVDDGRPPKYPEIISNKKTMTLLYNLCLLGATITEMSTALDIARDTFYEWMKNDNGKTKIFSDTIKKGKIEADARVGKSLFSRAIGYKHKATKLFVVEGEIISEEYIERFPPSEAAMNIWLKNRRGKKQVPVTKDEDGVVWKDRHDIDVTTNDNDLPGQLIGPEIDYSKLSDNALRELANAVKK